MAYSLWHFLYNASTQVEILGVWVRQENPIYTSHEFVISCGAVGGPNMRFAWYKDNRKVGPQLFSAIEEGYLIQAKVGGGFWLCRFMDKNVPIKS